MTLSLVPATDRSNLTPVDTLPPAEAAACLADRIAQLLRHAPARLPRLRRPHPLLRAYRALDEAAAGELCVLAAVLNVNCDERDTAEYLLRHRAELARGVVSGQALIRAAVRAAECDARRAQRIEMPQEELDPADPQHVSSSPLTHAPSVAEMVVVLAEEILGHDLTCRGEHLLADAVVVAMSLGERHRQNGGKGPSLLAMRPSARRPARLVTHLRRELDDPQVARALSRLLIGGDGAPLDSALLWWAAVRDRDLTEVPDTTWRRWLRDLSTLDAGAQSLPA